MLRKVASASGIALSIALTGILAAAGIGTSVQAQSPAAAARPALFGAAQAKSGEAVYNRACASCHGRTLGGGAAPPLSGPAFSRSWRDPRITLDDLFFVMRTTMPPRQSNALTADERVDVFAYILSVNGYPSGSSALALNTLALKSLAVDIAATTAPPRAHLPEFVAGAAGAAAPATGPDQTALSHAEASTDWLVHNHDYSGTRHSPLDQITAANASQLVPACMFQVGEPDNFQTNPIVHDGTMYVTTR